MDDCCDIPDRYDLAIVGSGGAAFAAAIAATNRGKRVIMIERGTVGGTCVNVGCVPSKALLAAANVRHHAATAATFPGLGRAAVPLDMAALIAGKQELVDELRRDKYVGVSGAVGWTIQQGTAAFTGTPEAPLVKVTGSDGTSTEIEADHYLVATGASPAVPDVPGLADSGYLTSTSAMELTEVPERLIVIGGGYVAMEQAQLFARLGSQVTVLVRSTLASREEPEVGMVMAAVFADEQIAVIEGAKLLSVEPTNGGVSVTTDTGTVAADRVLVATGRSANTADLGLEAVGVVVDQAGAVRVRGDLSTSNPRIHAAGDVVAHHQFVYVAAAHGAMVAENIFDGAGRSVDYRSLPRVTFTTPAVATVGLTDEEANDSGVACRCTVLPLEYIPRALVNRDTRGFIKMVSDAVTGEILGVTAVAQDAGELAAAAVHIVEDRMTYAQVASRWAPYLTMAEGLRIAAQSFTTDVSKLSCCS